MTNQMISAFLRQLADDHEAGRLDIRVARHTEGPVFHSSAITGAERITPAHEVTQIEIHHSPGTSAPPIEPTPTPDDLIERWGLHPAQVVANADNSALYLIVDLVRQTWAEAAAASFPGVDQ